ncbi:MAG: class II aldolase/adducin family protein [Clostridiales bacterium]|nr:class II aldolase/adducin family protein [Clostridiales bacterium]
MKFFTLSPAAQVAAVIRRIYERGLTTASGGNISVMDGNGDIWITPKSVDKGGLTEKDIVCVHPNGTYDGLHEPSSEIAFHRATYRARPDFSALVHAHPVFCIAFSLTRTMPRVDLLPDTLLRCRNMRLSKYAMMGSVALGDHLYAEFSKGADVVFLENHGVCVGAGNLLDAYQRFETIEYAAKLDLLARKLGVPRALTAGQLSLYENRPQDLQEPLIGHVPDAAERALREELVGMLRRGCEHGLLSGATGVCSARVDERAFLIAPEGMDNALLEEDDLVLVRAGCAETGKRPSLETALHERIYRQHANVAAVCSAAPANVMAFAASGRSFETSTVPESYFMLRAVPKRPFEEPIASPKAAAALFSERTPVVLFENNRVVTTGPSLFAAFDRLEVAEATAASILIAKEAGDIVYLSEKEIQDLIDTFHLD